jgi:hypothetical protein
LAQLDNRPIIFKLAILMLDRLISLSPGSEAPAHGIPKGQIWGIIDLINPQEGY